jgi:serine/threonine-protein kinase
MAASLPDSDDVVPGDRIGRYTVLRRLATGGMAEIYLARHEGPKGFSKLVVLKRVLTGFQHTEKFIEMFLDEGRLTSRMSHPNIAQTFELGEHDGNFHLAMEYVPGESLARLVKRAVIEGKAIAPGALLRIGMQVLEALDYAHDLKGEKGEWLKVVHRDVSPTNVIISYHGSVKLLDFGIARAASHQHETQSGTVKGKGGYMSPEQAIAGPVDQRTDVYAVGALMYLLVTGVGPFDEMGNVFAMMQAAVEARFPKPSEKNRGVDPALEAIILKAMATRPDDRFQTAGAMLTELEAYAASKRMSTGPRELGALMRGLFPDAAELARAYDAAPDEKVVDRMAQSFVDVDSEDLVQPTRLGRPARVAGVGRSKTPTGQRAVVAAPQMTQRMTKAEVTAASGRPIDASESMTTRLPSLPEMRPVGPVPFDQPEERDTNVVGVVFAPSETSATTASGVTPFEEEKTIAHSAPMKRSPKDARTISEEHAFPSGADLVGASTEVGAPITFESVADIVSRNPWAFVGAGMGAVVLGVILLWVFSG